MKELEYFENKIKTIIEKNEINNLYVFAETILEQVNLYGMEEIEKKYKLEKEDLFYLEIYVDALTIGDFDKDVFREFQLEKMSKYDETSLIEAIKHAENKFSKFIIKDNLNDTISG